MPSLCGILIYPIKSLDGIQLSESPITSGGSLLYDRLFAIVDDNGRYVNGKREPKVHQLRVRYQNYFRSVIIHRENGQEYEFSLEENLPGFGQWLSSYFGYHVQLRKDPVHGFPDDTGASGPTIVSRQTLELITTWFPGLDYKAVLKRFRPNLIIDCEEPFWEDHLFGPAEATVEFSIGRVLCRGVNPCARCVVPTRDPETGDRLDDFQKIFMKKREEMLPPWSARDRFDHFYRVCINTLIPSSEENKNISVGDDVRIIEKV